MTTPILKADKKLIIKVNYSDLERFINQIFAIPQKNWVEFVEWQEACNDTSYTFGIMQQDITKLHPEYNFLKQTTAWIEAGFPTNKHPSMHELLSYMAHVGHIDYGEYLVRVSW